MPLTGCGCQDHEIDAAMQLRDREPIVFDRMVENDWIGLELPEYPEDGDYSFISWVDVPANWRELLCLPAPRRPALNGHGWTPPRFNFLGDGPVYLGMELEVEIPRNRDMYDYAERARDLMGDGVVYFQVDSSINHGFEITTHPMSYAWAMESFPWAALDTLSDEGCSTHQDVGLHIHVSRAAFDGECHLYRWMKFIYRNEQQARVLGRRESARWASFDRSHRAAVKYMIKREDMRRGYDRNGIYLPHAAYERYQAINPGNPDTLEVRFFASSLRPEEVKAALAFVASTVEYSRDLDANKILVGNGWAWSSYVEWLRSHGEFRPVLVELEALSCVS